MIGPRTAHSLVTAPVYLLEAAAMALDALGVLDVRSWLPWVLVSGLALAAVATIVSRKILTSHLHQDGAAAGPQQHVVQNQRTSVNVHVTPNEPIIVTSLLPKVDVMRSTVGPAVLYEQVPRISFMTTFAPM